MNDIDRTNLFFNKMRGIWGGGLYDSAYKTAELEQLAKNEWGDYINEFCDEALQFAFSQAKRGKIDGSEEWRYPDVGKILSAAKWRHEQLAKIEREARAIEMREQIRIENQSAVKTKPAQVAPLGKMPAGFLD